MRSVFAVAKRCDATIQQRSSCIAGNSGIGRRRGPKLRWWAWSDLFILFFLHTFLSIGMSSNVPIAGHGITAPTPQNTPLNTAPIAQGLSKPTVPVIAEDDEQEQENGEDMVSDSPEAQALLLGMVQKRLAGLNGQSSGYIESLPLAQKISLEGIKGLQVQQDELQAKLKREITQLEKKVSLSITTSTLINPSESVPRLGTALIWA